jgi:hypothetical protein
MRTFHVGLLTLLFAALSLVALDSACGGGQSTSAPGTPTAEEGSVSQRITAADGGSVSLSDAITVDIPAGVLPADSTVTIALADDEAPAPTDLDGALPVGGQFKVDLGGQEPSGKVLIEIAFDPELLAEGTPEDAVFLAYYDEDLAQWVPIGGRVDKERNVVTVETDHLSWWNPFTWNWDAWIAVLHKTLSLRISDFVNGVSLLTGGCSESGQNVTVDNSKGNTVIKGCITKDDPASPELRVVNLKSFYVGLSPAAGGPGYPQATILGPGDAATFTADTNDTPPATVYADFTEAAMWRFVVGLVAEMLPGGDTIPDEGLAYIADGLAMMFSAQEASEALDAGDAASAAEHIYRLITGDKLIETFVELAAEYGQEHGVDMMSKWTATGVKQVFKAVAAVDVIISATDFLVNYVVNNHSAVAFSWAGPRPTVGTTPRGTPPPTRTGLGALDPREVAPKLAFQPEDLDEIGFTPAYAPDGWIDPSQEEIHVSLAHGANDVSSAIKATMERVYAKRSADAATYDIIQAAVFFFRDDASAERFLQGEADANYVVGARSDSLAPQEVIDESMTLTSQYQGTTETEVYYRSGTIVVMHAMYGTGSSEPQHDPSVLDVLSSRSAERLSELLRASSPNQSARSGTIAQVNTGGSCLNVREQPSTSAAVLECLTDGTVAYVESGPVTAEGYRWWKLRDYGWAAENWLNFLQ